VVGRVDVGAAVDEQRQSVPGVLPDPVTERRRHPIEVVLREAPQQRRPAVVKTERAE
jgi:hypothetical protein